MDELMIRWTVRLSLLAGYLLLIRQAGGAGFTRADRAVWTAGCLLMIVHVMLAFHFAHHWSHAAAVQDTAEKTLQVVGRAYGGGVWFNYAFLLTWLADVCWWWKSEDAYRRRPTWIRLGLTLFWMFIVFNATVIFEAGLTRWAGAVLFGAWLTACLIAGIKRR
ncbi:MAG: hypothetical protein ACI9TH_003353 [Kiritimatiellia bacterium]|jgi:hypothetical protein